MNDLAAPATILIVDDEPKNCKLLEVLLRQQGYGTVCVTSGEEALALVVQQAPDLILLDLMMPGMDGYEVARILKASPASLNIPIIMVSAESDHGARLEALNAGAEDFFSKPIHCDELSLRVRNLLRLKSHSDIVGHNSALLEDRVVARTFELQRLSLALDATADALVLTDRASLRYIDVNAAACTLLGYTRQELLDMGPAHFCVGEDIEEVFDLIIAGNGIRQPREATWRRRDGSEVCVEVNRQAVQTGSDWTMVSVARDITERKLTEAKLQQLAHYDVLTGLPNRRLFQESLSKAMEQADAMELQVVLLYLDVDNFKDINDSFGHAAGDELLQGIGTRLLSTLYARDSVGRLGGDEFGIILLTPRNIELAMKVLERIHEALRLPFELAGRSVATTASIGVTLYPADANNAAALAQHADMAMYEAKRSGRNTSRFYTAEMNQRVGEKLKLVGALHQALVNREFVLHYQPKVSLKTGRWTGVEALLRWQRPGHRLVMPNDFIPVLEDSGLIVPVGSWVVAEACRQSAAWRQLGWEPLPIAINVSALQFVHQDAPVAAAEAADAPSDPLANIHLLSGAAACLKEHGLTPGLLEVEITESVVMADMQHSTAVLQRLRALGVTLSVDDFGTGYSSLAYLRRLPLQVVKIDGSFIRNVTDSAEDASIAIAIIEMAHRLKLKVIAECVETAEHVQFLQAHECDEAQGYYFAKPMPVAELEALWRESGGDFPHLVAVSAGLDQKHELIFAAAWPECKAFIAALLAGDREQCVAIVEQRRALGHGMVEVDHDLIRPALYCIGEKWRNRQISIAEEHLATALAQSVMAHALLSTPVPEANGKKVLLACIQGNHHALGMQMVADAFTLAGWDVNFLGANVPIDALVEHTKQWSPDLLGLSASLPEHVRELSIVTDELRRTLGESCPPILLGGQGFDASHVHGEQIGGSHWASDPQSAVTAGEQACLRPAPAPMLVQRA